LIRKPIGSVLIKKSLTYLEPSILLALWCQQKTRQLTNISKNTTVNATFQDDRSNDTGMLLSPELPPALSLSFFLQHSPGFLQGPPGP
jgi:hypothetical protein